MQVDDDDLMITTDIINIKLHIEFKLFISIITFKYLFQMNFKCSFTKMTTFHIFETGRRRKFNESQRRSYPHNIF